MQADGLNLLQRLATRRRGSAEADSLTRAIEALLQSRRPPLPQRWQPDSTEGGANLVGGSVLNFGIPPVENWRLANDIQQLDFRMQVERAIHLFEPRIRIVEIELSVAGASSAGAQPSDSQQWTDQLVLRIQAEWRGSGDRVRLEAGWGIEEHRVWFRRNSESARP